MLSPATEESAGETAFHAYAGSKGVCVPQPFEYPPLKTFTEMPLSNDTDSHHVSWCAIFMQRLDIGGRPIEMQKLDKPGDNMKKCLGQRDAMRLLVTTIDAVKTSDCV
jgi:hypothetical protein